MKILAFAATNSSQSINKQVVTYSKQLLEDAGDVAVDIIDLNDYEMPIYSADREAATGIPQQAHDFFDAIAGADALLISFAEHNGTYTAAYKNLFDWTSRIDMRVYQGTPTVMLSSSVGPGGGNNVLQTALSAAAFFGNEVRGSLAIPSFHDNFDAESKTLTDADLDSQLQTALTSLMITSLETV